MMRTLTTLFRGRVEEAATALADRNALPILRQQIRDSARAVEVSRRAVAVAMAQNERETQQHERLLEQIKDLETRTIAALEAGEEALAEEAAEAIAHLEMEREASAAAQARFEKEIHRLRTILREAEARLRQLDRGERLAVATDRTQRLHDAVPTGPNASLEEAEATLARLAQRQSEIDATQRAMTELAAAGSAESVRDRLAQAGCGAALEASGTEVLERLRRKVKSK